MNNKMAKCNMCYVRAVGSSVSPGVPVLFGGYNLPHLVEIELTDLPESGGAMAPPAPPGTTPLLCMYYCTATPPIASLT